MEKNEIAIIKGYEQKLWEEYREAKNLGFSEDFINLKRATWWGVYSLYVLLGLDLKRFDED